MDLKKELAGSKTYIQKVKDLPKEQRPREKLQSLGPEKLSNSELLAIILRTGTKKMSVLDFAEEFLKDFKKLNEISELSVKDLKKTNGIGLAKACEICATFTLAKRMHQQMVDDIKDRIRKKALTEPRDAFEIIKSEVKDFSKEQFFVLSFDIRNKFIEIDEVSAGTLSSSLVHPRETFKIALKRSAAQIIIAHNHPSGDPEPSEDDIKITRRLTEAGKIMGIEVIDHIIATYDNFCSFKQKGLL
jgi:DNA repair protein RadC